MNITAKMVKDLRDQTGAGMMDCKKALTECDADIEKAIAWLREKGKSKQEKKASRVAAEGTVKDCISATRQAGALLELNIETDFAAKNENFQAFAEALSRQVVEKAPKWINREEVPVGAFEEETANAEAFYAANCLSDMPYIEDETKTVKEALSDLFASIGENIVLRRFVRYECGEGLDPSQANGQIASYIHGGGRCGVLVEINSDSSDANQSEDVKELARNLCMQVAAMSPAWLTESDIPEDVLKSEHEVARNQALNDGKPEKIVDRIADGRVKKFVAEKTLLNQTYVRDENLTCGQLVESVAKKLGYSLSVRRFIRYELGEGIEKKEEDFAEEVRKQLGQ
ncbi:MAG: translation elongation factor Ts [Eubacteriales bacterium]|nr:translation elongation factor Ts [Eubacteriales bacterium]